MTRLKEQRRASEARRCSENLRRLLLRYRSMLEDRLRAEGLTLAQLRLLKAIQEGSDVSAAALARRCFVTPQTLQGILSRTLREKWILRKPSRSNKRVLTASLTASGEAILQRGSEMAADIEERIWRGVKTSELEGLNELLGRGVSNLEAEDVMER